MQSKVSESETTLREGAWGGSGDGIHWREGEEERRIYVKPHNFS